VIESFKTLRWWGVDWDYKGWFGESSSFLEIPCHQSMPFASKEFWKHVHLDMHDYLSSITHLRYWCELLKIMVKIMVCLRLSSSYGSSKYVHIVVEHLPLIDNALSKVKWVEWNIGF
jgi:hypothetical protein